MAGTWTEEEIAAFVDGELDAAGQARIAAVIGSDPAAARLAAQVRETDAMLREAFAAPLDEPVPGAIAAGFEGRPETVVPLRRSARRLGRWAPSALAASLAMAIGLGTGLLLDLGQRGRLGPALLTVGPAGGTLLSALDTVPSGQSGNGIRPLASFPVEGGICREFEVIDGAATPSVLGMACRNGDGWSVIFAVATSDEADPTASDGFAPATGAATDAIGPLLDSLGAGPALDPEAEAAAILNGWSR